MVGLTINDAIGVLIGILKGSPLTGEISTCVGIAGFCAWVAVICAKRTRTDLFNAITSFFGRTVKTIR